MSEATKKMLADIREAKKAGTYVKLTAEEKKARAREQAKARRASKKAAMQVLQ